MAEGVLEREAIHSSLQPVRGMASPQLGWTWNLALVPLSRFGTTPFRSTWLALLGLLGSLEINLSPLGIDSIQATLWASMNLGLLISTNCLMSTLFERWSL